MRGMGDGDNREGEVFNIIIENMPFPQFSQPSQSVVREYETRRQAGKEGGMEGGRHAGSEGIRQEGT